MNPLRGIRAVTFDAGGTLIEPWPSVGHVYAAVARMHGINADPAALNRQFARAWKAKNRFDYSRGHWFALVEEAFGGTGTVGIDLFDSIYNHFTLAKPWHVFEDVLPTLEALKRHGMKLAVISNWDERLRPLLGKLELDRYFDVLIISTEVGAHKPDPRIFEAALRQLGVAPHQALHIGDSHREDVAGARAAGLGALCIRRGCGAGTDDLSDLTQLIRMTLPES